uniref:Putative acyl-protein thioesterase 1 n=1 Tax=Oryza minuta TaxID=63629 RepID=G9C362_ORYMI|nr:putative acyl-protein thioesterase 1 [Oryza minuta]
MEPATRSCRFVVWLHDLGDTGRANEFLADSFSTTAAFADARWAFPTAPTAPKCVRDEEDVLRAVLSVHAMIDREIAAGTNPRDVFVFGLSQGGALGIASVLLYPKTLGGCAVFSGFLPFNSSFAVRVTAQAKKTPVLWIHGRADSLIPIEEGRDGTKFLRGLGMSCEFKVYDRLGHLWNTTNWITASAGWTTFCTGVEEKALSVGSQGTCVCASISSTVPTISN